MADKLVLEAEVKSNIAQQAAATEAWGRSIENVNDDINDTNRFIIEQEKELIKLKAKQDAIPKGAFYAGMGKLKKDIADTTTNLKLSKNALKNLKEEQKSANAEIKKFNKEQKESAAAIKGSIGNFQVFGVSLNGIKKSVSGIIPMIKLMFKSITAGIMSTGIGVLLIAFGSLMTYLTTTKEGMDKLNVVIAKISAAFNVVKDRIAGFGKIVGNIFSGKTGWKEGLKEAKENFEGMGEEMKKEVKEAGELEKATQKLRDINNEFIVTQAKKNKQIAEARLLSEDETVAAEDRLKALQQAQNLEKELVRDEVANQKERVRILKAKTEMSNSTAADEKALADARVQLINVETKSLKQQKKLAREMNSLENEIAAEKQKRIDDEQAAFDQMVADNDAWNIKQQEEAAALLEIQQQNTLALIEDLTERAREELRIQEEKELASVEGMDNAEQMKEAIRKKYDIKNKKLDDGVKKQKEKDDKALMKMKIGFATDTLGAISQIAGKETKVGKAAAIAQATVSGAQSVMNAFNTASLSPLNAIIPGYNFVQAGLAAGFAVKQIKDIASSKPPSGGGGGGGGGEMAAISPDSGPAPQMMSGAFELGGGTEPEPTRAYVLTDEMTDSQNQLANIRRRATI